MKYIIPLFLFVLFTSCKQGTQFNTVTVDGEFEIDIPEYMTESAENNELISLQYENLEKETYVIVINEDKNALEEYFINIEFEDESAPLLEHYCEIQQIGIEVMLEVDKNTEPMHTTIDGKESLILEYEGIPEEMEISTYFYFAMIESKTNIYKISTWCMTADKDEFKPDFEMMAQSFREL